MSGITPDCIYRVALGHGLCDGCPFALAIAADHHTRERWRSAETFLAAMADGKNDRSIVLERPDRTGLINMRSLQALDGYLAGASEREIATVIFGEAIVARSWHSDGDLRASVRYLIRRGRACMNGGYRKLLWAGGTGRAMQPTMPSKSGTGRKAATADSP